MTTPKNNEAFVVVSMRGVAKARLTDGEIHVIPTAGMDTLYLHREDGTATLTYSDGSTYKLNPLTYEEAFPPEERVNG